MKDKKVLFSDYKTTNIIINKYNFQSPFCCNKQNVGDLNEHQNYISLHNSNKWYEIVHLIEERGYYDPAN